MKIYTEETKHYGDLYHLNNDLEKNPVTETKAFPLKEMELTRDGIVVFGDLYNLNHKSLQDAFNRGGLQASSYEKYLEESSHDVHEGIVYATNKFYQNSRFSDTLVKLITRLEDDGTQTVLGIPSHKYTLFTHKQMVAQVMPTINNGLKLDRCIHYPEYLELAFTNPKKAVKDKVGEIVQVGVKFINSEGTRTRALQMSAFTHRLICSNGATAKSRDYMRSYVHKGNMENLGIGGEMQEVLDRTLILMEKLPRLAEMPITQRVVERLKKPLLEALGKPYYMTVKEELQKYRNLDDVWNKITNIPQDKSFQLNAERKLKLEQIGFDLLVENLV